MAVVAVRPGKTGKVYLSGSDFAASVPQGDHVAAMLSRLECESKSSIPSEPITTDAKNSCWTHLYGLTRFSDLFNRRQLAALIAFVDGARKGGSQVRGMHEDERGTAITAVLAMVVSRPPISRRVVYLVRRWRGVKQLSRDKALPMVRTMPTNTLIPKLVGSPVSKRLLMSSCYGLADTATVRRGSAMANGYPDEAIDAVVTDPPYYETSRIVYFDFFYVWLKRILETFSDSFAEVQHRRRLKSWPTACAGDVECAGWHTTNDGGVADATSPEGQLVVVYAQNHFGLVNTRRCTAGAGFIVRKLGHSTLRTFGSARWIRCVGLQHLPRRTKRFEPGLAITRRRAAGCSNRARAGRDAGHGDRRATW